MLKWHERKLDVTLVFPGKNESPNLPSSLGLTWARLRALLHKLQQKESLLQQHDEIFQEKITRGIIEEADFHKKGPIPIFSQLPYFLRQTLCVSYIG